MMDHAANLARIQALRGGYIEPRGHVATLDHVEDVLTRHAPDDDTAAYPDCPVCLAYVNFRTEDLEMERWPCPDYTSALTLLDALDGGAS